LSATDWIGTVVIANRYVSTVSPSEIDTGIFCSTSCSTVWSRKKLRPKSKRK